MIDVNMSNINYGPVTAGDVILDLLAALDGGALPVASLCRGAALFGLKEQSVRVALTRLVQNGKVRSTARGIYALDPDNNLLSEVRSWIAKEQRTVSWTNNWVGACDAMVARSDRASWRRHARALELRGFKTLSVGLHIRPDNLTGGVALLRKELSELGLAENAIVMVVKELAGEDDRRARELWDVAELTRNYRQLLNDLMVSEKGFARKNTEAAATESLLIGRKTIRQIIYDPLLPEEIMSGELRHELIERMRGYQARARDLWLKLLD